jgi:hypothetical protein
MTEREIIFSSTRVPRANPEAQAGSLSQTDGLIMYVFFSSFFSESASALRARAASSVGTLQKVADFE